MTCLAAARRIPSTRVAVAALLFAASVGTACGGTDDGPGGGGTPTPAATAAVTLGLSSFSPSHVAVFTNGVVTWNNTAGVTHNVTFSTPSSPADIADHGAGTNDRTFPTAGVYNYGCTIHAGMSGRVTVVTP